MAEAEQQDSEESVELEVDEQDPGQETADNPESDEAVENEIVLAGQEDALSKPDPKSKADHIQERISRKKDKDLQGENARLRAQLEAAAQPVVAQPVQSVPDEDDFDDRQTYLVAKDAHDRQMLTEVVGKQLNQQQNGHRVAAQQQQRDAALTTYAQTAAKLNVSDFNDTQDRAFDVLGDDFASLIAEQLPEDAPKILYYLGKNPRKAEEMRDKFALNPGSVTFALGKLAGNLTIKPKRTAAAQPEGKIEGGAVGGLNEDWQSQYTKILDSADDNNIAKTLTAIREIKKQAKQAGFDVSTLK